MKIFMLKKYKHKDQLFDRGKIYLVTDEAAQFLIKEKVAIIDNRNAVSKFHNKMLKINYEVKDYVI